MKGQKLVGFVVSMGALVSVALANGPATAELRAVGLEEAAFVAVPEPTHMTWMTRTIDGAEHTIAVVGSRSLRLKDPSKKITEQTIVDQTPAGGLNLIDLTDPAAPVFLLNVYCPTGNNDVAVIPVTHVIGGVVYDTFILLASNDTNGCAAQNGTQQRGGVSVVGLRRDPRVGESVSADWLRSPFLGRDGKKFSWSGRDPAAHTVVAHPTRPIAYVGNQNLADRMPSVEILDLSVWPPIGRTFELPPTGVGPHDITFQPDGRRAFASSINLSFIWDTSGDKVFQPELISTLVSPNLKIHHEATLHPDGRHLLVVDEFVASSSESTPNCPGGGIHVFDIGPTDPSTGAHAFERAPVVVGQFYAPDLSTPGLEVAATGVTPHLDVACTAHEFDIPASGDWMPLAWFGIGVRLLDLSSLVSAAATPATAPVVINEIGYFTIDHTDVWAAKQHPNLPGYIVATDTALGVRILRRTA